MKAILTTSGPVDKLGHVALVDPEDFDALNAVNWTVCGIKDTHYALRHFRRGGRSHIVTLHGAVVGPIPPGFEIDHRNGNGMDNRKENLRVATRQQNQFNKERCRNNTSGFKGVHFHKHNNKWQAEAVHPLTRKLVSLGYFDLTPDGLLAAARVYDDFAKVWHGEFARLNLPNDSTAAPISPSR